MQPRFHLGDTGQILDSVVGTTLGQELRRLRMSYGMSLCKLAGLLGMTSHSGLVDYERDCRIPPVDLMRAYERVLQPENDVLMGLYRRALLSRASVRISQDVGSRCVCPNEPIGQMPSTDTGTSLVALRAAAQRAREFAHNTPAPIGAELIDQVLDDVRVLATTCPLRLTADVVSELVVTQDRLFALLSRRHTPATARQLLFAAGVLGGMLANACLDLGDSPAASCQAHAAFVSADQAGHDGLRAWVTPRPRCMLSAAPNGPGTACALTTLTRWAASVGRRGRSRTTMPPMP